MIRMFSIAAVVALVGVTSVVAQTDPIATRKAAMKNVGAATGSGARIAKGEAPFSLDEAKRIFQVYVDTAKVTPNLYPDTSKTGGDTSASPKIWEDNAAFKAAFAKWGTESEQAAAGVKDLATFQAAFGNVTKNCGSCHETFRVKR